MTYLNFVGFNCFYNSKGASGLADKAIQNPLKNTCQAVCLDSFKLEKNH